MGCFNCFSFLLEPIEAVRSMHGWDDSNQYLLPADDGDFFAEDMVESIRRAIKAGKICRVTPVKETSYLIIDKDDSGRKVVNDYVRERTLYVGNLSKVALYRSNIDGKEYAIKSFYKSRLQKTRLSPSETAMTDVLKEVSIMKMLEHPNIVNLIEVINDPDQDPFYMVLEYAEGDVIFKGAGPPGGIGKDLARSYFRDTIAGLMYLHDHHVIHGDIKPENLLVTASSRVKICDFGVSHFFEGDNDELRRSPGTPVFTAPECCSGVTYHGKAADVWALGITLYCMLLGCCPFLGETLQETFDKILHDPLRLPDDLDPEMKDLLKGLLHKDPKQRFTLQTAAEHQWVVGGIGPIPLFACKCKQDTFQRLPAENGDSI